MLGDTNYYLLAIHSASSFVMGVAGAYIGKVVFFKDLKSLEGVLNTNAKLLKGAKTNAKVRQINMGRSIKKAKPKKVN